MSSGSKEKTIMATKELLACYKWVTGVDTIALLLLLFNFINFTVSRVPIFTVEVLNEYPHDPTAYTEGLLYGENDSLYESTGLYGQSSVRRVNLQTGKVEALQEMPSSYFGEGLTLVGERDDVCNKGKLNTPLCHYMGKVEYIHLSKLRLGKSPLTLGLYQLTWDQKIGFIYDRRNLSKVGKFDHQMHDGWGLTTDGKVLFGSDGSSSLYQIDVQTMKGTLLPHKLTVITEEIKIRRLTVRDKDIEVYYLNELEYVNGEVWANIMPTDCIVRISPEDGMVLGWILLSNLREKLEAAGEINTYDVLNGIAWDNDEERIFVTGKNWPKLYEIKVHQLIDPSSVDIQRLCITMPRSSISHIED